MTSSDEALNIILFIDFPKAFPHKYARSCLSEQKRGSERFDLDQTGPRALAIAV
jgi:hypothetical protein